MVAITFIGVMIGIIHICMYVAVLPFFHNGKTTTTVQNYYDGNPELSTVLRRQGSVGSDCMAIDLHTVLVPRHVHVYKR